MVKCMKTEPKYTLENYFMNISIPDPEHRIIVRVYSFFPDMEKIQIEFSDIDDYGRVRNVKTLSFKHFFDLTEEELFQYSLIHEHYHYISIAFDEHDVRKTVVNWIDQVQYHRNKQWVKK